MSSHSAFQSKAPEDVSTNQNARDRMHVLLIKAILIYPLKLIAPVSIAYWAYRIVKAIFNQRKRNKIGLLPLIWNTGKSVCVRGVKLWLSKYMLMDCF